MADFVIFTLTNGALVSVNAAQVRFVRTAVKGSHIVFGDTVDDAKGASITVTANVTQATNLLNAGPLHREASAALSADGVGGHALIAHQQAG